MKRFHTYTIKSIAAKTTLLFCALLCLQAPVIASASQSDTDINSIVNETPFYDPDDTGSTCDATSTGNAPTGTLPSVIPEPYNGAFTNGGNKHKVAPALVAAIFTEENLTTTPTSQLASAWQQFVAGNYGGKHQPVGDVNSGWPTNEFQTEGAFQFIPGTWAQYGDDGDGNGTKDAQYLADGAAGAANYLAANGGTTDVPPASWQNAIFAYNHAQWYVDAVMMYYNFYNQGGTSTSTTTTSTQTASNSICGGTTTTSTSCDGATTGNIMILCEARKFDKFGYLWGGGHEDPENFMSTFNASGGFDAPFRQVVDCSGLEVVSIWLAFHQKVIFATSAMSSMPQYLRHISVSQAQPGDLMYHPGHTEIATDNGGTTTFGAHTENAPPDKQIGDAKGTPWTDAYVYVGPGSDRK